MIVLPDIAGKRQGLEDEEKSRDPATIVGDPILEPGLGILCMGEIYTVLLRCQLGKELPKELVVVCT
jgi:hypothetical protein